MGAVAGLSAFEGLPRPKEDRPVVLEVRDGFVRVWREDCRTAGPWGFRVDEETADMVKGKVRPGVAALEKLARRAWPAEKVHRRGMR